VASAQIYFTGKSDKDFFAEAAFGFFETNFAFALFKAPAFEGSPSVTMASLVFFNSRAISRAFASSSGLISGDC
jgi:hypothetical protein